MPRRVSCVSFNQDGSRLAAGFDSDDGDDTRSSGGSSFCVFSCEPVSLESTMSTSTKVTSAALLYKTRVSALVLASQPNVVALHDGGGKAGATKKTSQTAPSLLGELSFPASTKVLAVALRRDAVAVALSDGRAAAYSLDSLRLLRSVETGPNELGLLALAAGGARTIFACPWGGGGGAEGEEEEEEAKGGGLFGGRGGGLLLRGSRSGGKAAPRSGAGTVRVEFVDAGRSVLVRAARHAVAALALSREGSLLATASERGTLVRVFSLEGGGEGEHVFAEGGGLSANKPRSSSSSSSALTPCLRELRRGGDPARMLSLAFSPSVASFASSTSSTAEEEKRQQQQRPRWIAAASDKGTVHVWSLSRPPPKTTTTGTAAASHALLPSRQQLLAAAAAAAGAPSPSSLAAERSAFHFKLPGFDERKRHHEEVEPALAALSFSPGGKAVFAASAAGSSGKGGGSCGLVAVALPEDEGGDEDESGISSSFSATAAAAELFCVPDLFALLPQ